MKNRLKIPVIIVVLLALGIVAFLAWATMPVPAFKALAYELLALLNIQSC